MGDEEYEAVYRLGLKRSIYNFVLVDYSYFQFATDGEAVRYAYYPNPFRPMVSTYDLMEQMEEGLISFEELAELLSDERAHIGIPPLRYEYAPTQYREIAHPCAHFHIGHHGENRWPIARRLTPLAFTMWIVKMYYPMAWGRLRSEEHEFRNTLDGEMAKERRSCGEFSEEHFSARERRLFHFT